MLLLFLQVTTEVSEEGREKYRREKRKTRDVVTLTVVSRFDDNRICSYLLFGQHKHRTRYFTENPTKNLATPQPAATRADCIKVKFSKIKKEKAKNSHSMDSACPQKLCGYFTLSADSLELRRETGTFPI